MKSKIDKRDLRIITIAVLIGIFLGWLFFSVSGGSSVTDKNAKSEKKEVKYFCSMHPQIKQNKPGLCPICAMDLVPMPENAAGGENVDPNEIALTEAATKLANIQTTIVQKGAPKREVSLLGKIKPDERNIAQLTARFGGRIEKLMVNYTGQVVKRGEVLGTVYSPQLVTAQKELLEAVKFKNSNPSFYAAAYGKLKLWDLNDEQITAIVEKGEPKLFFDVLSPISGTVTKRHIAIGDYIKEGAALFEVINLKNVWVMFDAYESDLAWINKGDYVKFNIQSLPGKQYSGKVTYIDPFIDAKTRVAKVRVELPNQKLALKPEMFVNGILHSNVAKNSSKIMIPKSSVLWTGKRAVVYVKVPDRNSPTFIYREIILGPEAGRFYIVSKGLLEGEKIAVNGVFKIDAAAQLSGLQSMMNPGDEKIVHIDEEKMQRSIFKVAGNCGMCKETIEKAAKSVRGVNSAVWDAESKEIKVVFNKTKTTLQDIHIAITNRGYDTDKHSAKDEVYENLHSCCKYTRGEL